mmetsp:Transcript_21006/g.50657  ORF Transcript_21006/g.50657 Transcript_21006/m.50657 type:complete len:230 (+) Transcript_21006:520-1209(+)
MGWDIQSASQPWPLPMPRLSGPMANLVQSDVVVDGDPSEESQTVTRHFSTTPGPVLRPSQRTTSGSPSDVSTFPESHSGGSGGGGRGEPDDSPSSSWACRTSMRYAVVSRMSSGPAPGRALDLHRKSTMDSSTTGRNSSCTWEISSFGEPAARSMSCRWFTLRSNGTMAPSFGCCSTTAPSLPTMLLDCDFLGRFGKMLSSRIHHFLGVRWGEDRCCCCSGWYCCCCCC